MQGTLQTGGAADARAHDLLQEMARRRAQAGMGGDIGGMGNPADHGMEAAPQLPGLAGRAELVREARGSVAS